MGMIVQHNMNALSAYNKLNTNVAGLKKSSEKLSSGYRINRAGDDAAGLAISEKMRSQIRGLNQAKRNSQDGISMIQTFEGALQESHSILQRMKELAAESANGTYQNEVDRDAIQLEFNQLNDELDQIADTDFNGTVMLNGGQMADGLKQVDGKFDYSLKAGQLSKEQADALAAAQAKAQANIDAAQKTYDAAKVAADALTARDLCNNGTASQWNTVDDNGYTKEIATTLFDTVTDGTDSLTDLGVSEFEAVFEFDGNDWTVKSGSYTQSDGTKVDLSNLEDAGAFDTLTAAGNGGFKINNGTADIGNVVLDATDLKAGDTVALKFTNTASRSYAPDNIGMDEATLKNSVGVSKPTLTLGADVTDANMNAELEDALTKLDKADITFNYSKNGIKAEISESSFEITETGTGTGVFDITFKNSDNKVIKLAQVTTDKAHDNSTASAVAAPVTTTGAAATSGTTTELTYVDGVGFSADGTTAFDFAAALDGLTMTGNTQATFVTGTPLAGDKLVLTTTAGSKDITASYTGVKATVGKVSFNVAVDAFKYDVDNVKPTIDPSKNKDVTDADNATVKAFADAKVALDKAKAAYPGSYEDLGIEGGVSKADSFDKATAPMTYTDHLVLQAGARTKDSVDFTFSYKTDGMGTLKANLNVSSREDGLNTKNLSLNTQEGANAAIDKIDNAINKVSMVRATFGATQNRLEHKVENLTTTAENLTEAEAGIRDTDMAQEMLNYTKFNVLQQAAQSMLAQANQQPQSILQLLG